MTDTLFPPCRLMWVFAVAACDSTALESFPKGSFSKETMAFFTLSFDSSCLQQTWKQINERRYVE